MSADISAWSTNHKRALAGIHRRVLSGSVGIEPDAWLRAIEQSAYLVAESEYKQDKKTVQRTEGTFQGFTVFSDTAVHISAIKEAAARAGLDKWHRKAVYMDDVLVAIKG